MSINSHLGTPLTRRRSWGWQRRRKPSSRQVDGLVLVAPWLDAESIERFGRAVPTVTVALHGAPKHFDTVVDDERLGARLVVDHLVALGNRRIVHTSMPSGPGKHHFSDVIETYHSDEGGYEAALQAFDRDDQPSATSPARTSPRSECCVPPRSVAYEFRRT